MCLFIGLGIYSKVLVYACRYIPDLLHGVLGVFGNVHLSRLGCCLSISLKLILELLL
jgi:hypothetical protein